MHLHGPIKVEYRKIPAGVQGIIATLQEMRRLVRDYKVHPVITESAARLAQGNLQKDFDGEVRTLHAFVRDQIRYLKDPRGVEMVQSPDVTLRLGHGDCDDKATLLAAMLEAIGHATRFVAVGYQPGRYSHVYLEALTRLRGWIPLETTELVPMGWSPRKPVSRLVVTN